MQVARKKPAYMPIPYGCTVHGEEEIAAVTHVLRTSTQMGKHVHAFEQAIAQLFAKEQGLMVNSGSSANYLAIEILNLPPGAEIITPVLTFATTLAPIVQHHLIPALVDVELETFNINVSLIEEMITHATRALMIPNLLGNLPHWQALKGLADHHNLILIEDSADTLGASFAHQKTGAYSAISTTSFYGSHIINCAGNGGMICVNNPAFAERIKLLRSWGRTSSLYAQAEAIENRFNTQLDGISYDAKFIFSTLGYNFEPSELGAAFGLVQLEKLSKNILTRKNIFTQHTTFFKNYAEFFILPKQLPESDTAWLAFPLIVKDDAPFTRTQLQIYLEQRGIQTRTIFSGNVLRQPAFKNIACRKAKDYPQADLIMRGGLLIGCHHGLTPDMVEFMHQQFIDFLSCPT